MNTNNKLFYIIIISLLILDGGITNIYSKPKTIYYYPETNPSITTPAVPLPTEPLKTYTIPLYYSDPIEITATLMGLYPELTFTSQARTRTITLKSNQKTYQSVRKTIQKLDRRLPQFIFEVQIIEINDYSIKAYSHLFSDLKSGFKINYNHEKKEWASSKPIEALIHNLTESGHARIIAKPTVSVLDNHEAKVQVGDKIPYITSEYHNSQTRTQVHYLESGIFLSILPKQGKNKKIVVDITAKITSVKLWKSFGTHQYPILSTRETHTIVEIQDKETLILAGLFDSMKKRNENKTPLLSHIPIFGTFFKGKNTEQIESDIIFLITPKKGKSTYKITP